MLSTSKALPMLISDLSNRLKTLCNRRKAFSICSEKLSDDCLKSLIILHCTSVTNMYCINSGFSGSLRLSQLLAEVRTKGLAHIRESVVYYSFLSVSLFFSSICSAVLAASAMFDTGLISNFCKSVLIKCFRTLLQKRKTLKKTAILSAVLVNEALIDLNLLYFSPSKKLLSGLRIKCQIFFQKRYSVHLFILQRNDFQEGYAIPFLLYLHVQSAIF